MRFPEFTEEWETKKLGEVATNKSEKYNPANETDFIKCIEMEHLITDTGQLLGYIDGSTSGSIKNVFNEGDVLFGKLRPYLKKYLQAPFDGVCSSEIWVLKGKNISNDFLYRIVQTKLFIDLANQSSGSKMPRADWNVVESGSFSIPTPLEQKKISSFLALLDERIQTQNKIIEQLETLIKGLCQKLILNQVPNKKINNCVSCYSSSLTESDIIDKNGIYPVYGATGVIAFTENSQINEDAILIIKDGSGVGKVQYASDKFSVIGTLNYLTVKPDVNLKYIFFCLKFFNFEKYKVGSGIPHIYFKDYGEAFIYCPSVEEQIKIERLLSSIDEKIKTEKTLLQKYEIKKRHLLQNLFI